MMSSIGDTASLSSQVSSGFVSSTDPSETLNVVADPVSRASRGHIRTSTPPSTLCTSSPALLSSPIASERVRTRVDSPPSALAFLAAVCSSPSVHWDGLKHHYLDTEKGNPCDDATAEHDITNGPHMGHRRTSFDAHGGHVFPFVHELMDSVEDCEDSSPQKSSITRDVHCSTPGEAAVNKDDDLPAAGISASSDYSSDFAPSSPTALSLSSPSHRLSCDFTSSSERSITLPLSSPGPPYMKEILSSTAVPTRRGLQHDPLQDTSLAEDEASTQPAQVEILTLKAEPLEVLMPKVEGMEVGLDLPRNGPEMPMRSLSPLHAPSPIFIDHALSPISSALSSPLSEPFDLEPSSAVSSHFRMSSSAVSSRSASPVTDMGDDKCLAAKHVNSGRRASTNVISSSGRRLGGDMGKELRQRSDTAPPEPTPRKRRRRSSPSSPVLRTFQVHRVSSPCSPSPSYSKVLVTSSAPHEENHPPGRKWKTKPKKPRSSTTVFSSKVNRVVPHKDASRRSTSSKEPQLLVSSSSNVVPSDKALSDNHSLEELTSLPMTGFLVETLALSRASAMAAPELLRAVLKSQPHLMEERSEDRWSALVRCILEQVPMFGRIERRGTVCIFANSSILGTYWNPFRQDAADRPLEDQWFYIPENDEENGRAELLKGLMPNKRSVTKRSKQYYFEPVQKLSRWDPEDD